LSIKPAYRSNPSCKDHPDFQWFAKNMHTLQKGRDRKLKGMLDKWKSWNSPIVPVFSVGLDHIFASE
jgi:hypothetical protein